LGQVGIGEMDETNLEFMRKYDYTLKRLVLIPLHDYERKNAERCIDDCFMRYGKIHEIIDFQWTHWETYDSLKSTLINGNERLDNYQGENMDWWEERICGYDDLDACLGEYIVMRGFLNFLKFQSRVKHLRLSENAETMVYAINKLFVHYVEQSVQQKQENHTYNIQLVKSNED
jgi:hypothetical protein